MTYICITNPAILIEIMIKENTITDKILVTYASRAGSTAGVAEAIGQTLDRLQLYRSDS